MFMKQIDIFFNNLSQSIIESVNYYWPKVLWALFLILLGIIAWVIIFKSVKVAFKKFKIIDLIDRLTPDYKDIAQTQNLDDAKQTKKLKFTQKVKVDEIVAKAWAYYIFLVFFRYAIVVIGINEVEKFMDELLAYLPSLFIAVIIGFFGYRFSNLVHDITFHTLKLTKQKTAKIIASWAKMIVLFFTLMVVLDKVGIATNIIEIILTGFVAMVTLAGWIAFGLWWKEVAQEILESFKK